MSISNKGFKKKDISTGLRSEGDGCFGLLREIRIMSLTGTYSGKNGTVFSFDGLDFCCWRFGILM
nr:hypothetical protein [uncultured Undibacterium sp.]